ncbi:MAG: RDD family protein [Bacillota bacterium]|nr:RDD family protein [Bacillota bacterium]
MRIMTEEKIGFAQSFIATIIDQIILGAGSTALVYLIDFIMRKGPGLYIAEIFQAIFIIYIVATIIYNSVLVAKKKATIGQKFQGLVVGKK